MRFVFLPFLFLSGLQPLPPRIRPRLTARPNPSSSIPLCPGRILARNRSRGALATSRPPSVSRIRCRAWRWTRWTSWASPRRTSPSPNVSSLFSGYPLRSRRILAPFIVLKFDAIRGCCVDGHVLLGLNNLVSWVWFA
jgi:hypothetical protein